MWCLAAVLLCLLCGTACRATPSGHVDGDRLPATCAEGSPDAADVENAGTAGGVDIRETPPMVDLAGLGAGAAPGGTEGPGGFVSRGSRRNFYAGAGGRLWYYMNNYYWVSETAPLEDLWIQAAVVETFEDLERWPDGAAVASPDAKRTVEYWAVGPTRRSVRLDNHKDYLRLDADLSAGAIRVQVTLTLGRVEVRDEGGRWGKPSENYVLEFRNYRDDRGIGAERTRFVPLRTEAVTVWEYRIPWSTHPQRLTRSNWQDLELPAWSLLDRKAPPSPLPTAVTPSEIRPRTTEAGGE